MQYIPNNPVEYDILVKEFESVLNQKLLEKHHAGMEQFHETHEPEEYVECVPKQCQIVERFQPEHPEKRPNQDGLSWFGTIELKVFDDDPGSADYFAVNGPYHDSLETSFYWASYAHPEAGWVDLEHLARDIVQKVNH